VTNRLAAAVPGAVCAVGDVGADQAHDNGAMPRNVEIKARIPSVAALLPRAQALAGGAEPQRLDQDDSFFACAQGRLKLRRFADGSGELIAYQRADAAGPRTSDYLRVPLADPDAMHQALARTLGSAGRVHKQRWLLKVGATRIHLDEVQGLGSFLELEVVLQPGQTEAQGQAVAQQLMAALGVAPQDLVAMAYVDLLRQRGDLAP
jgi:predicted adenylyl cyclase CyaB